MLGIAETGTHFGRVRKNLYKYWMIWCRIIIRYTYACAFMRHRRYAFALGRPSVWLLWCSNAASCIRSFKKIGDIGSAYYYTRNQSLSTGCEKDAGWKFDIGLNPQKVDGDSGPPWRRLQQNRRVKRTDCGRGGAKLPLLIYLLSYLLSGNDNLREERKVKRPKRNDNFLLEIFVFCQRPRYFRHFCDGIWTLGKKQDIWKQQGGKCRETSAFTICIKFETGVWISPFYCFRLPFRAFPHLAFNLHVLIEITQTRMNTGFITKTPFKSKPRGFRSQWCFQFV